MQKRHWESSNTICRFGFFFYTNLPDCCGGTNEGKNWVSQTDDYALVSGLIGGKVLGINTFMPL